ncbi:MAG: hypothetical protein HYV96_08270 [Opitutae bacterium]|nr:hypothetical protein [Opitutae bacterium]
MNVSSPVSPASRISPRPAPSNATPTGSLVDIFGGRYHRIAHSDRLAPFFMNVVSSSDLWLFVASNGGLTAGRSDAEQSLFPYQTVDRIYDSAGVSGPVTALWVATARGLVLWRPFAPATAAGAAVTRTLYKSVEGDRLWFEETNTELGLVFRYGWSSAENHGLLRRCELENLTGEQISVRLVDGLRNILPSGVSLRLQNVSSCLTDAYKTAEFFPESNLGVFSLAAAIVDRAIALESLRASIVWSDGLPKPTVLLSDAQLGAFLEGGALTPESHRRGVRCSYLLASEFIVPAKTTTRWMFGADIGLTQSDVAARRALARSGQLRAAAVADADASTAKLRQLVAAADGFQRGADDTTTTHHFTNVLFNIMRGGVFAEGHAIPTGDFAAVVARRNRAAAQRHAALLASLPATLTRAELLAHARATGDADLARLAEEYLPLTFSRRHGDPSRPWNKFKIRVRDEKGQRVLAHEGNWRDIFQNWEALCVSYPEFIDSAVAKFLSASTADGYNPYRVTHTGIDWETPDHEDPWASIGYWGDHQVIYLQKLLEWSGRYHPGRLHAALREARYAYANVPYRLANYADTRRDPRVTIQFESEKHRAIVAREAEAGTDARLIAGADGRVLHVNLTEKLLLLALTRMTNFVAGGGIWMNTQRPEWNDANNALVGYGVSFVTLAYLRRMLAHVQGELLSALGSESVAISSRVLDLLRGVHAALDAHRAMLASPAIAPAQRRSLLDALATAGSDYREAVYRSGFGAAQSVTPQQLAATLALALEFVDHTLRNGLRADGLYQSYSRLEFTESPAGLEVHELYPMLEGQVAVLSSGLLAPAEVVRLLRVLRDSPLHRADQRSYLLYPDRQLAGFLARNTIPPEAVASSPLLNALLAAGDDRVVVRDAVGAHRFQADLANADALRERLAQLAREPRWSELVRAHGAAAEEVYEQVFHHRAFTGRSGSMFGYEGLGCIYWHMVAKLLLAVQENLVAAEAQHAPEASALRECYYEIRAGLGFNKTPAEYGAFPTDPYSHTPGHSGAQQPGMTGQVKEEVLTRWGELGVRVEGGALAFRPTFLRAAEFTVAPATLRVPAGDGREQSVAIPARALAFTFCGVPVIYQLTRGAARVRWTDAADAHELAGTALDAAASAALFARTGRVTRIEVELGDEFRPL